MKHDKQLPRPALEQFHRIAAEEQRSNERRASYTATSHEQRLHNRGLIRVWHSREGAFCALTVEGQRFLKGAR